MANRIQVSAKELAAPVVVEEVMAMVIEVAWVAEVTTIVKVLRTLIEVTLRTSNLAMERETITTEVVVVQETFVVKAVEATVSSMSANAVTAADTTGMAAATITEEVMTSVSPMEPVAVIIDNSNSSSNSSQTTWWVVLTAIMQLEQAQVHLTSLARILLTITLLSVPTTP